PRERSAAGSKWAEEVKGVVVAMLYRPAIDVVVERHDRRGDCDDSGKSQPVAFRRAKRRRPDIPGIADDVADVGPEHSRDGFFLGGQDVGEQQSCEPGSRGSVSQSVAQFVKVMVSGRRRWQYPDLGSERGTDHTYSGLAHGARLRASGACNSNNGLRIHASRLHVQ